MDPNELAQMIGRMYRERVGTRGPGESQFATMLRNMASSVQKYENEELIDKALEVLPLERLYSKAEEMESKDDTWALQDYLVMELLKWFKQDFFQWVNNPPCSKCGERDTQGQGPTKPTDEELKYGARVVELYRCPKCNNFERFARYNDPGKLLETHCGRCGEWANHWDAGSDGYGTMRTMCGLKSTHPDKSAGFIGMGQAIALRGWMGRYVRDPAKSVPRNKISEDELASVLKSITAKLRSHLPPAEREQLEKEDKIEQEELAGFGQSPSSTGPVGPRTTGSEDWIKSRGEDGHS